MSSFFLRALKGLYHSVQSRVDIQNGMSDWFDAGRGVRQGCPLSPLLYCLYTADLAKLLRDSNTGISIGADSSDSNLISPLRISCLLYIDDIVL